MAKKEKQQKGEEGADKVSGSSSSRQRSKSGEGDARPRKAKKRRADEESTKKAAPLAAEEAAPEAADEETPEGESTSDEDTALVATDGGADEEGSDEDATDDEEDQVAAQLGIEKYVLAGFFASAILVAFLTGRIVHLVWAQLSNRDWFSQALPSMAAVTDDSKLTYGTIFGALVALLAVIRCYRSPRVRGWTDEVAGELAKVKWPNKKEVTSHTLTVLAASGIAMTYLALLDRLWGFVTNLVYGTGT
jgi:preprotein translocase subunit SecE